MPPYLCADILETPIEPPSRALARVGSGAYGLGRDDAGAPPRSNVTAGQGVGKSGPGAMANPFKDPMALLRQGTAAVAKVDARDPRTATLDERKLAIFANAPGVFYDKIRATASPEERKALDWFKTVEKQKKEGVFGGFGDALVDAAKGVGSAIGSVASTALNVIAAPLRLAALPVTMIAAGVRGENMLDFAGREAKRSGEGLKQGLQAVAAFGGNIPIIGTGVAAAIGAGLALADGKNIGEAVMAGARDALPGGPVAHAAFDAAAGTIGALAAGQPLDHALLAGARAAVPGGELAKKAFDAGVALAEGKRLQDVVTSSITSLAGSLAPGVGQVAQQIASSPALKALGGNAEAIARQLGAPLEHVRAALPIAQKAADAARRASGAAALATPIAVNAANAARSAAAKALPAMNQTAARLASLGADPVHAIDMLTRQAQGALGPRAIADELGSRYGSRAPAIAAALAQVENVARASNVPAAAALRAVKDRTDVDTFATTLAGHYGGPAAQAVAALRATGPQVRKAGQLIDKYGAKAMQAITLGQPTAGNPVGLAIAELAPAEQSIAQTILADPRLRGMTAENVARVLKVTPARVQGAIGAIVAGINHVSKGAKGSPGRGAIADLASRIGPGSTLDAAMGAFASRVAPITHSPAPHYARPGEAPRAPRVLFAEGRGLYTSDAAALDSYAYGQILCKGAGAMSHQWSNVFRAAPTAAAPAGPPWIPVAGGWWRRTWPDGRTESRSTPPPSPMARTAVAPLRPSRLRSMAAAHGFESSLADAGSLSSARALYDLAPTELQLSARAPGARIEVSQPTVRMRRTMPMPASLRQRGPFFSRMMASGFDAGAGEIDAREVADAQSKLRDLGYPLTVDGVWGPKTAGAVKDFQSKHGLQADGVYGEATKMALAQVWNTRAAGAGVPIGPPAPPGMNVPTNPSVPDPTISDMQKKLSDLNYGPLERDGLMGPATKAAVKKFQASHPPLAVDGVPGPQTRTALEKAWLQRTITKPPTAPGAPPSAPTPIAPPIAPPAVIVPGPPQMPAAPRQIPPPPSAPLGTPPLVVKPPTAPPVITVTPSGAIVTPQPTPIPRTPSSPTPPLLPPVHRPPDEPSLSGGSQRPPADMPQAVPPLPMLPPERPGAGPAGVVASSGGGSSSTGLVLAAVAAVAVVAMMKGGKR